MRIHEILGISGAESPTLFMESTQMDVKELIRSVVIPLKAQKVDKITVDQLMDNIRSNPQLQGIDIDQNYIVNQLGQSKVVNKVQADPENNGLMTVYFDFPVGDRQIDAKQKDKETADIKKAAVKQVKDKLK